MEEVPTWFRTRSFTRELMYSRKLKEQGIPWIFDRNSPAESVLVLRDRYSKLNLHKGRSVRLLRPEGPKVGTGRPAMHHRRFEHMNNQPRQIILISGLVEAPVPFIGNSVLIKAF